MNPAIILQSQPDILLYTGTIYLISAVVSFIIAAVIFSFLHRFKILQDDKFIKPQKLPPGNQRETESLQHNKWIKPFAQAFLVLAVMYSIRFLLWLFYGLNELPNYISYLDKANAAICSSLSNYFFFAVVFYLARRSRRYSSKILETLHINEVFARVSVFVGLFIVAVVATTGSRWERIPDILVSMPALFFVGLALYRNISFRRGKLMAWIALLAAIFYAVLHIPYGLNPWITPEGKVITRDLIIFSLALPLKFGLFFPAYALMLMIANPIVEVRRLLRNVTHGSAEFLKNDGVVRSIQKEIRASRAELYIKLPDTKRNKVARYSYPPKIGAAHEPEQIPFDKSTDYGDVMSAGDELLFRLINYSDQVPEFLQGTLPPQSSIIAVPILFHNVIIGCLKVELDKGKFTEADMQNIQRFAAMVSPSVQDYREVDALNEISHRLTQVQIESTKYEISEDIKLISQIAHDILAPLATGVSIEAGFCHYKAIIPENEPFLSMIDRQPDSLDSGFFPISENENLSWLVKHFKIASNKLKDKAKNGEHSLGKLILVTDKVDPPILAANFLHHLVVSNLVGDALLNFIRGYLGEVNRKLGVSLSGLSEANVANWFATLEKKAGEAGLAWAVASQPGKDELLGEKADLVRMWESRGSWEKKETYDEDTSSPDIWLCTIGAFQRTTSHIIKISLRETGHTLWLGVGNSDFKFELDYLSPWASFVLRFGELADTTLQRIIDRHEREKFEKEAADFHGLATAAITTGTVIHQMVNQVRDLTAPLSTLEEAIRFRTLVGNENHKRLILSLGKSARQIEELTKLFSGVTKPDERRPCSLNEAVQYAFDFLRDSLARYNIRFDPQVTSEHLVDVPFYVAAFALANLLNNAKDAIRDGKVKEGVIQVRAEEARTEKMILCHVTDNGPGVPPHLIGQLFESSSKSDKPHGRGLGLYLSARSLRENRGDIRLTHPGPNPQTTFTIYFPKQRED